MPRRRVWDAFSGNETCRFERHLSSVVSVAISPDGRSVVSGDADGSVEHWKSATGDRIRSLRSKGSTLSLVGFSPDGRIVYAGGGVGIIERAGVSRDSQYLAGTSSFGQTVLLALPGAVGSVSYLAFDIGSAGWAALWDADTGKTLHELGGIGMGVHSMSVSPDGRQFATGGASDVILWDRETGEEIRRFHEEQRDSIGIAERPGLYGAGSGRIPVPFAVNSVCFSPKGDQILVGCSDKSARLVEIETGKEFRRFSGHAGSVQSVCFCADGKYILTASEDKTVRLWDASRGDCLGRLICFRDGDWAVVDSVGRYDASNGGNVEGLHWVVGTEPISLDQLKARYYDPGLLSKIMGLNLEPLRDVSVFDKPKLYPKVELVEPTSDNPFLDIRLTNRGGGIGPVVIKINGKELTADARGRGVNADAEKLRLEIPIADDPRLLPGQENTIEVLAYNAEEYLRSRGILFKYTPLPKAELTRPHLWAVIVGVSDYLGDEIDLRYAAIDAEDFAAALRIAGTRLFGENLLHFTVLTTERTDPAERPTCKNILASLNAAAESSSNDILVVYLAGHGLNYGGQSGDFYFLTCGAGGFELADPDVRHHVAVSSRDLAESIKQIPALKQAMILDTCASGRLVQRLTDIRQIPSSQIRAIERVKDRTGIHILAGCAADAVSYEASRYAQGLLTHTLLLGMRGAALREEQFVDVLPLFGFAVDRVPQLAQDIGGIQRPIMASPKNGASFDIGQIVSEDRSKVPLQPVRPFVVRTNLQEEEQFRDVLGLANRVDQELRDIAERGPRTPLVFLDASDFPEAYQIVGRYRDEPLEFP